jgi:branched-chain amino acid aminotransferase
MLSIEWTEAAGWLPPRIIPYDCLRIDPAACSLQYACECFEGMKAYKDRNGGVRLFRPDRNMVRLNSSAARIALPPVDEEALVALIAQFVLLEERFIPS